MSAKNLFRSLVRRVGYDIVPYSPTQLGVDPWADMGRLCAVPDPVVFDVGANAGQTVARVRARWPHGTIHAFEPSPATFATLRSRCAGMPRVHLVNAALGAERSRQMFLENSRPDMSSFRPIGPAGWGEVVRETDVAVDTLDAYCRENGISRVDVLKSDTQGYELEVFKGAGDMLARGAITFVFFEHIFAAQYEGLPCLGAVYDFLGGRGYRLVSFYRCFYRQKLAAWTDLLFIHGSAVTERADPGEPGPDERFLG